MLAQGNGSIPNTGGKSIPTLWGLVLYKSKKHLCLQRRDFLQLYRITLASVHALCTIFVQFYSFPLVAGLANKIK